MNIFRLRSALLFLLLFSQLACTSEVRELIDLALDPPSRQPIDQSRTGVNNFFVDPEFGSTESQFLEIRDTLRLNYVRVLFAWTNEVQPTPDSIPDYNFYDSIVERIPPGVDILVTLVHTPDWMADPANWINGDPRATWVERWLRPTVERYAGTPGIIGWQVWNEPDNLVLPGDASLELVSAANYFDLLALSSSVIRLVDPTSLVVMAATRSIQQDSGRNLQYNRELKELGAEGLVDIWAIHYYGEQFEQVVNQVGEFVRSLQPPIWITESGAMGPNNQLAYVETVWPFIDDEFGGKIQRFYYYQFGETGPNDSNFGLRQNGPILISDLYASLSGN